MIKEIINSIFVYITLFILGLIYIPICLFCQIAGCISELWDKIWKH